MLPFMMKEFFPNLQESQLRKFNSVGIKDSSSLVFQQTRFYCYAAILVIKTVCVCARWIGKSSSYLECAFFMGYVPTCLLFMLLANKLGRKPVILLSIAGSTVSLLFFGFSLNFPWAIVSQFACGAFGGVISVVRTYNAEVS